MLECIEDIELYCASGDIGSDQRTLDAVLRRLQILTESSTRVSAEVKAAYDQVRWRELAGFRNVVVHDYLGIRVERIWPISRGYPEAQGADSRNTGCNRDQALTEGPEAECLPTERQSRSQIAGDEIGYKLVLFGGFCEELGDNKIVQTVVGISGPRHLRGLKDQFQNVQVH
jgi:uncharacterized protein with HEPN domain